MKNIANRACPQCGTLFSSSQAFCSNCGRPYSEPMVPDRGRAALDEYRQPPLAQGGGPTQTPQPKRSSKTGLFIGISGLVVLLLLIGTGFFLFTKGKGNSANSDADWHRGTTTFRYNRDG